MIRSVWDDDWMTRKETLMDRGRRQSVVPQMRPERHQIRVRAHHRHQ